jgi:hypothetical protein
MFCRCEPHGAARNTAYCTLHWICSIALRNHDNLLQMSQPAICDVIGLCKRQTPSGLRNGERSTHFLHIFCLALKEEPRLHTTVSYGSRSLVQGISFDSRSQLKYKWYMYTFVQDRQAKCRCYISMSTLQSHSGRSTTVEIYTHCSNPSQKV